MQLPLPALSLCLLASFGASAEAQLSVSQQDEAIIRDLDLRERPLKDVVEFLRDKSGVNIIMDEGIDALVTLRNVKDMHWRAVLILAAEKAGCVVVQKCANVLKVEKPPRTRLVLDRAFVSKHPEMCGILRLLLPSQEIRLMLDNPLLVVNVRREEAEALELGGFDEDLIAVDGDVGPFADATTQSHATALPTVIGLPKTVQAVNTELLQAHDEGAKTPARFNVCEGSKTTIAVGDVELTITPHAVPGARDLVVLEIPKLGASLLVKRGETRVVPFPRELSPRARSTRVSLGR